jgi:hypothetical protein
LKEIQDRLRREKREQELDAARAAAEARVLELERRMAEERETWVVTLKNQLSQRDADSKQLEDAFSSRLVEFERKWSDEKSRLEQALAEKTEEAEKLKQSHALEAERSANDWEKRFTALGLEREAIAAKFADAKARADQERAALERQREERERELLLLKSTQAMAESQHRAATERLQKELSDAAFARQAAEGKLAESQRSWQEREEALKARVEALSRLGTAVRELEQASRRCSRTARRSWRR